MVIKYNDGDEVKYAYGKVVDCDDRFVKMLIGNVKHFLAPVTNDLVIAQKTTAVFMLTKDQYEYICLANINTIEPLQDIKLVLEYQQTQVVCNENNQCVEVTNN